MLGPGSGDQDPSRRRSGRIPAGAGPPLPRGVRAFDHSSLAICPGYQEEKDSWHVPSRTAQFSQDRTFSELVSTCTENVANLLGPTGEGNWVGRGGQAGCVSAFAEATGHRASALKLRPDFTPSLFWGRGLLDSNECILLCLDSCTEAATSVY